MLSILAKVKEIIESNSSLLDSVEEGEDFEKVVLEALEKIPGIKSKDNGKHAFPDIEVNHNNICYGLEVKFSKSGLWRSKGNSVFESIGDADKFEEIYIIYGRRPKKDEKKDHIDVRYATYGESIDKIEVTHSPRFAINMNSKSEDIKKLFAKYESYSKFRALSNEEKNAFLREYFKYAKDDLGDKWYIQADEKKENLVPVNFKSLPQNIKNDFKAEAYILYPKYLFKNKADYSPLIPYMIVKYFAYSSSLRDCFSSGGKGTLLKSDKKYPKILVNFYHLRADIKDILNNPRHEDFTELCFKNWRSQFETIDFSEDLSLENNYYKLLEEFKPTLEVEDHMGNKNLESINLLEFFTE